MLLLKSILLVRGTLFVEMVHMLLDAPHHLLDTCHPRAEQNMPGVSSLDLYLEALTRGDI